MPTDMKRMTVTIPKDLEETLNDIKQRKFYGDSWTEMLQRLLEEGAKAYTVSVDSESA